MNKKGKLLIQLFVLGLCWATIYSLAFVQYLLYDPLKEALNCSNAQLGLLMTIFGLGNVVGAPIGGWLADHFDFKKIFVGSLILNGIICFVFAMHMTYTTALICWVGMAVAILLMNYPSHIKIIGILGGSDSQGKIYGFNEASVGLGSIIVNAIFLFVFGKFVNQVAGMRGVSIAIGAMSILCGIAALIVLKDVNTKKAAEEKAASAEDVKKNGASDFIKVIKAPETWLLGIGIFAIYSFVVTMSYFTPYFTAVLGGTVAMSGVVSLVRTYGLRFVGPPVGGWFADKIKSPSKVLIIVEIIGIACLLAMIFMPKSTSTVIMVAITLIVGFIVYAGKGVFYAVGGELSIPQNHYATTVGVAAALGFSPDIFLFALHGHFLDAYGNTGYTYIFTFQIAALAVGICGSLLALHFKKKIALRKEGEVA